MSEEIENNEVQNPVNNEQDQQTEMNPTPSQEQDQQTTEQNEAKGGTTQTEEKQKEEETKPTASKYTKIGREMKQKVTSYNTDARNALAREVAEIARNKDAKLAEKKALIENYNAAMVRIEAEIKALEKEASAKSEIACTGEKREQVLCDAYQTETEIVYVAEGGDPEKDEVIARSQRVPEQTKGE